MVAPERDKSGASNSLTLDRPLSLRKAPSGFYFVSGTPTDCVMLAVRSLLGERPALVVSGVELSTAFSAVIASINNTGPGIGIIGPGKLLALGTLHLAEDKKDLALPLFAQLPPICGTNELHHLGRAMAAMNMTTED